MTTAPVIPTEQYRRFGATDLMVSPLGFGGAPIGWLQTEVDAVGQLLNTLLDHGVNVIDTAAAYGGSEDAIGQTIGDRRDEFTLISKCGRAEEDSPGESWSPAVIRQQIERSLSRLRTDRIDVMLLHTCDREVLERGEALGAVLDAKREGLVRWAGYSGDNDTGAFAATLEGVDVIQTSINICDQVNIDSVLPEARRHDVGVMMKRPLANAAWKPHADQYAEYQNYARPYHERFDAMSISLEDLGIDGDPATIWPEIALRFALSFEGTQTAIIGTTRAAHVQANLNAVAKGPLSADAVERLRNAFDAANDGSWVGLG